MHFYFNEVVFFFVFSGFFPVVINFLRRVPVIGNILNFPGISQVCRMQHRISLKTFTCLSNVSNLDTNHDCFTTFAHTEKSGENACSEAFLMNFKWF